MAIKAHLDHYVSDTSQRRAPRRALRLETSCVVAGTTGQGREANVTIHNISAAGLLLETELKLAEGEELALDLPEADTVLAAVVWRSERLYGCAFAQALGPAALAAAQLQSVAPEVPSQLVDLKPLGGATLGASEVFGSRLNRLRREAGLTLADVAAALSVSKPTVWAWEKGKARPLPERLDAIAAALGTTPDQLAVSPAANEIDAVIAECRLRIAEASGARPEAVRIMLEL
ncbi:MAG: helix-turn-helix domain-containing protein [Erythrobacter sp.]